MNIHSFLSEHWVIIYGLTMYLIGRVTGLVEELINNKKRKKHNV
jgi:hypothetical protein